MAYVSDEQLIEIVGDAVYNEPYNNPSVRDLAERHGLDAADIRREFDGENWHNIRRMICGEIARQRVQRWENEHKDDAAQPTEKEAG